MNGVEVLCSVAMADPPSISQAAELEEARQRWLRSNRADVEERLAFLWEKADGILRLELSGSQFIVVKKDGSLLSLGLVRQTENPTVLVQSKLDLVDPFSLVLPYNQAALLGLLWCPQPRYGYMAGLGGGRIPMVLHHHFPQLRWECTEISPEIVPLAVDYFGLPCAERFEVILQDSRAFLVDRSDAEPAADPYDLMVIDIAQGNGFIPYSFVTQEFYYLCRDHLDPEGILVINCLWGSTFLTDRIKTLRSVFEEIYYCRPDPGNIILLAPMTPRIDRSRWMERARSLQAYHQFSFPFVELADQIGTGDDLIQALDRWEQAQILTDADPPEGYGEN